MLGPSGSGLPEKPGTFGPVSSYSCPWHYGPVHQRGKCNRNAPLFPTDPPVWLDKDFYRIHFKLSRFVFPPRLKLRRFHMSGEYCNYYNKPVLNTAVLS